MPDAAFAAAGSVAVHPWVPRSDRDRARDWFAAATTGLAILARQIAYLPTLYGAYNRREPEVALLNARAGVPPGDRNCSAARITDSGGASTIDTMPALYEQWERWAADVADSHSAYLPWTGSAPQPLSSWVTSLLAVLDSAALFLSLSPKPRSWYPLGSACAAVLTASPGSRGPWASAAHDPIRRRDRPHLRGVPRRG